MECARLGAALDTSGQCLSILCPSEISLARRPQREKHDAAGSWWVCLKPHIYCLCGPYPKRRQVARTPQKSLRFIVLQGIRWDAPTSSLVHKKNRRNPFGFADREIVICKSSGFLPSALGRFGNQTLLDCFGGDADIFHLSVNDHFDTLKVRYKPTFGDTGDMRTDTAFFLGFTTAPNVTSLDGPLSC